MALTRTLIEVSSFEGDDVYRATAAIADPMLRTRHKTFNDEKDDPELFVRPRDAKTEAAYLEYWSLQERAFRRVGTATRRWVSLQQKAVADANTPELKDALRKVVLKRLLDWQLQTLDQIDSRLALYLSAPPQNISAPEHAPELLVADLVLIGLLIGIPALIILAVVASHRRTGFVELPSFARSDLVPGSEPGRLVMVIQAGPLGLG